MKTRTIMGRRKRRYKMKHEGEIRKKLKYLLKKRSKKSKEKMQIKAARYEEYKSE